MKYYLTANNECGGRPAKKGANEEITIGLDSGNCRKYNIIFKGNILIVFDKKSGKCLLEHRVPDANRDEP